MRTRGMGSARHANKGSTLAAGHQLRADVGCRSARVAYPTATHRGRDLVRVIGR